MAKSSGKHCRDAGGRPLPRTMRDFTGNCVLDEHGKRLVLELNELVTKRFGTMSDFARHLQGLAEPPTWVTRDLAATKKKASDMFGCGARRLPDWPTVALILDSCPEADPCRFAGWWRASQRWGPPGYDGPIAAVVGAPPAFKDPEEAPDAATRAEMYRDLTTRLHAAVAKGEDDNRFLIRLVAETERQLGGQIRQLEDGNRALRSKLGDRVGAEQRRNSVTAHRLAMLTACFDVQQDRGTAIVGPGALLGVPDLVQDDAMLEMFDHPGGQDAGTMTRFVAVYLRIFVVNRYGADLAELTSDPGGRIRALVDDGRLPSATALRPVFAENPVLAEFLRNLVDTLPNADGAERVDAIGHYEGPTVVLPPTGRQVTA